MPTQTRVRSKPMLGCLEHQSREILRGCALAPRVLPGSVGADTASAVARSESSASALALLLVSPEFLRR